MQQWLRCGIGLCRQADKARLVAEKLQVERDALWSPRKVRMRLGVSAFFSLVIA